MYTINAKSWRESECKLISCGNILRYPNADSYDCQNSNCPSRPSRTSGRTISGVLFFLFGTALLKIALDLTDIVKNPIWFSIGRWVMGAVAALIIYQGTILVLTGNWVP